MTTRSLKICAITTAIAASIMLSACLPDLPTRDLQIVDELYARGFNNIVSAFRPAGSKDLAFYADVDDCRVKIFVNDADEIYLVKPDGEVINEPTPGKVRSDDAFKSCVKDPESSVSPEAKLCDK